MILVDIYVPAVDKTYDFQLNENVRVDTVIEELSEMVGQKERSALRGRVSELILCDRNSERILKREESLQSAGITNGGSLILV
ncbi:MAG: glutamyl-tRNA amidotransferase [Lachnospiraceae bacterium]|nr:glutamyl-tRNA amidotransferase [Lachnospiraceae bacterium]